MLWVPYSLTTSPLISNTMSLVASGCDAGISALILANSPPLGPRIIRLIGKALEAFVMEVITTMRECVAGTCWTWMALNSPIKVLLFVRLSSMKSLQSTIAMQTGTSDAPLIGFSMTLEGREGLSQLHCSSRDYGDRNMRFALLPALWPRANNYLNILIKPIENAQKTIGRKAVGNAPKKL